MSFIVAQADHMNNKLSGTLLVSTSVIIIFSQVVKSNVQISIMFVVWGNIDSFISKQNLYIQAVKSEEAENSRKKASRRSGKRCIWVFHKTNGCCLPYSLYKLFLTILLNLSRIVIDNSSLEDFFWLQIPFYRKVADTA